MSENEKVFRPKKTALRLLSDDLVNETRDMLAKLVEFREGRKLSVKDVADIMGLTEEDILEFESYGSDPTVNDIVRYGLAVSARIHIEVTDGDAWARHQLSRSDVSVISSWIDSHSPVSPTPPRPEQAFDFIQSRAEIAYG